MNNFLFVLVISILTPSILLSQVRSIDAWESGVKLGMSNYQGDLVREHFNILESNPGIEIYLRYFYDYNLAFHGSFSFAFLTGDDRNYSQTEDPGRYDRGLRFENQVYLFNFRLDYFPLLKKKQRYINVDLPWQPYFGLGLGLNFNDPELINQNPNRIPKFTQKESPVINSQFSAGIKYYVSDLLSIAVESVWNIGYSDKLDGYVFKDTNDIYMFHGVVLSVSLEEIFRPYRRRFW
mgnify:CR=1 FL=1|jgi:hypothetical protein